MTTTTLTRIRRTIVAALAAATVAAPSALADPWARDASKRPAKAQTAVVRDGWFSRLPDLAQDSNVVRSSHQHDERFAPVSTAGSPVQHDERFAPVSTAGSPVQHDERFAPVRVSAPQVAPTGGGSQIDWGNLVAGAGIGIAATLLLGFAALGVRGRRLAHS